jgi:hypothetical protein
VGEPVDLQIVDANSVRRAEGSLEVHGKTLIRSDRPADKIIKSIRQSGEITIEAWIRPANTNQDGPARIVTLSKSSGERNFTLGQEGDQFDARFRTTKTGGNGIPSVSSPSKSLTTKLTHLVYTRDRNGRARIYLNGRRSADGMVAGALSNWDGSLRLALANELTSDRPWLGTYHLVAIYNRALPAKEVAQNFKAGVDAETPAMELAQQNTARTQGGLQALYDFSSPSGNIVKDRSGVGEPMDLRISEPKSVRRTEGSLEVRGTTLIRSEKPAGKIIKSIRRSGSITIEAWIRSAKTNQSGPARVVTLSKSGNERNFTLGQDGDKFDARFRTTETSNNGIPSLSSPSKSLRTELQQVVYTRDRAGRARVYINGQQTVEKTIPGATSNWNESFRFGLANELTNDRPWLGTYYLVAIYGRDLLRKEIEQNFQAGPSARASAALAERQHAQLFESQVASLLARHCLECHDSSSKKGGLDLSRKEGALAGGESGRAINPGKAAESLLWEFVESDEMPKKRPALSAQEKKLLRQWIDSGAIWTRQVIDPAIYAHDSGGNIWVQRLTVTEYIETVRAAVGMDIEKEARELLPRDLRADGFSNTAYNLNVDLKHVDAYARLAEIIVSRMDVEAFAKKFSKSRLLSTDATMREFVASLGKWLLRGPLDEREVTTYSGIATTVASAGGDYKEAVGYLIEAMLQSPRFIYRIENQRGDGTAWPVGDYELASRLSYILWGGPPDAELMKAADAGDLDRSGVERQVQRMLDDPRAITRSTQFIYEWLDLDRLDNMQPSPQKFPNWDGQLAGDMRDETIAFFRDVVWKQKRPLSDLLNAQVAFATPRLAEHYGLEVNGEGLSRYDVSAVPGRGGLLTQGSVLTVGGDQASMVSRGLFVLHDLLRGVVKDPPPCVDTTPVPSKPGLTQRAIAESRIANANCGGCHAKFEPLAFGLEKFDGLGAYHEQDEHGNKLRDDGQVLFPGRDKPIAYQSSLELMDLLAESGRVRESITWKLTQFALGRPLGAADAPIIDEIHKSAQQSGATYGNLITAVVLSDLVQKTRTETEP